MTAQIRLCESTPSLPPSPIPSSFLFFSFKMIYILFQNFMHINNILIISTPSFPQISFQHLLSSFLSPTQITLTAKAVSVCMSVSPSISSIQKATPPRNFQHRRPHLQFPVSMQEATPLSTLRHIRGHTPESTFYVLISTVKDQVEACPKNYLTSLT